MLKLVTFNIRCDYDQDGANSFRFRKPVILKKLAEEKPDVICFQEVLPHVAVWLKENLTEYTVIGCGRSETLEDEQMTVAFRTKRLNLINMETFWLSPTPYVPASDTRNSPSVRVCARKWYWKIFRRRKSSVCVISTWIISACRREPWDCLRS